MKSRLISMLLTGLALAIVLLIAAEISQSLRSRSVDNYDKLGVDSDEFAQTLSPAIVTSISESNGRIYLVGRAEAGSVISIQNRKEVLRQIKSAESGDWDTDIAVNETGPMLVDFLVLTPDGAKIRSDQTLIRIPAPEVDSASTQPQALVMVVAAGGPTRIIQSPFRGLPSNGVLAMGPIDYDKSGGVIFSGQSETAGRVRVYANQTAIGESHVQANGDWYMMAANTLPNGRYEIRAELIGKDAEVIASVSVPFERMSGDELVPAQSVRVHYKPFSWQVRRGLYGGGQQFTAVFAPANGEPIITQ